MNEKLEKLGKPGRDIVTGFEGTVTGICFYWGGTIRIALTSKKLDEKSGETIEEWFDEVRVEVTL